jgi:thiaminase
MVPACLDGIAAGPAPSRRAHLSKVFRQVARWENAFWEMSWKQQGWPALEEQS